MSKSTDSGTISLKGAYSMSGGHGGGHESHGGPFFESDLADMGVKITHTLVYMVGPGAVVNILCGLAMDGTTTPDDPSSHGGGHGGH